MWTKETTCKSCDKDFSYEDEELRIYETIYEGGLVEVEFVFCLHCGSEVITHIQQPLQPGLRRLSDCSAQNKSELAVGNSELEDA